MPFLGNLAADQRFPEVFLADKNPASRKFSRYPKVSKGILSGQGSYFMALSDFL
ncbi:MAG: hypothetical protein UHS54_01230 [Lachnospiraceae bacterium]|nr:hypothetical protein [Lachnospiraceae bacterium]